MLRVSNTLTESHSNGPGIRSVIWVQGCSILCKNCWNYEALPTGGGSLRGIEELFFEVTRSKKIEGVSILGGEPFDQMHSLLDFIRLAKIEGLSVMIWSGFTLSALREKGNVALEILNLTDILVDGPFQLEKKTNLLWRGSSNQEVHFLTDKYIDLLNSVNVENRNFEIIIEGDSLILTGDPTENIRKKIHQLSQNGWNSQ